MSVSKSALTTGEISKYCGVHFRTVIRWIERGELRAYKLPGRGDNRVMVPDFLDFLQRHAMPVPEEFQSAGRKVLIAESDDSRAASLSTSLQKLGYETEIAADGFRTGLLLETFQPALLVLNLDLPGMNGFEVLKFIRDASSRPDVMILALATPGDALDEARERGADAVLTQPLAEDKLIKTIENMLAA